MASKEVVMVVTYVWPTRVEWSCCSRWLSYRTFGIVGMRATATGRRERERAREESPRAPHDAAAKSRADQLHREYMAEICNFYPYYLLASRGLGFAGPYFLHRSIFSSSPIFRRATTPENSPQRRVRLPRPLIPGRDKTQEQTH